ARDGPDVVAARVADRRVPRQLDGAEIAAVGLEDVVDQRLDPALRRAPAGARLARLFLDLDLERRLVGLHPDAAVGGDEDGAERGLGVRDTGPVPAPVRVGVAHALRGAALHLG